MTEFATADDILESQCSELLEDIPKIDSALKNLISMSMAAVQTDSEARAQVDALQHQHIMTAARDILREVNCHIPISAAQWGLLHPQDDLPALDRLAAISMYKSAVYLVSKISSQNLKPSKCFGRKYLQATKIWPAIYQKLSATPAASSDIYSSFLTKFHNSMTDITPATTSVGSPYGEDLELIWCEDFSAALRNRQMKRVAEAARREEAYKEELRRMIATGGPLADGGADTDALPRVEYLGNAEDREG